MVLFKFVDFIFLVRVMVGFCMFRKLFMINLCLFGKINFFFIVCFGSLIIEKLQRRFVVIYKYIWVDIFYFSVVFMSIFIDYILVVI